MKSIKSIAQFALILLMQFILLWSCKDRNEAPPFPVDENEYEQPETKTFEFSEADTLDKISLDPFRLNSLPKTKFDWDNLPSKPFDIGLPYAKENPFEIVSLDWDSLPTSYFNLDSLPKEELKIKIKVLGEPKRVKAGQPVIMAGASRGVMTLDANFGFSGTALTHFIDSDGMIWFGTTNGIVKYDSEMLEIYDYEQGLTPSGILKLFQDSKGRIWIGDSAGGLKIVDLNAKLIYELSSPFDSAQVLGIMEAKDGKFWVSNGQLGYRIIDLEERSISLLNKANGLSHPFGITPFQDENGLIWLTTGNGIDIIDLKNLNKANLGVARETIQCPYTSC